MTVKVGQVWRDCDKRYQPTGKLMPRFIRVVRISQAGLFAFVKRCSADGLTITDRETRINISRMKPGATGYELVKEQSHECPPFD